MTIADIENYVMAINKLPRYSIKVTNPDCKDEIVALIEERPLKGDIYKAWIVTPHEFVNED